MVPLEEAVCSHRYCYCCCSGLGLLLASTPFPLQQVLSAQHGVLPAVRALLAGVVARCTD